MHDYTEDQSTAQGERVLIGDELKQPDLQKEGLNLAFLRESEGYLRKISARSLYKKGKKATRRDP